MTRIKLILIALIATAIAIMLFPTKNDFQPKTVWEHYCKYTLHIHPSQATEDHYEYFIDGDMKPAFYFEIPRDTNRYLIRGILDEAGYPHCCLLGQPKQMFNPQLN